MRSYGENEGDYLNLRARATTSGDVRDRYPWSIELYEQDDTTFEVIPMSGEAPHGSTVTFRVNTERSKFECNKHCRY